MIVASKRAALCGRASKAGVGGHSVEGLTAARLVSGMRAVTQGQHADGETVGGLIGMYHASVKFWLWRRGCGIVSLVQCRDASVQHRVVVCHAFAGRRCLHRRQHPAGCRRLLVDLPRRPAL